MKRSVQEIIELLVFGLIALLIGTGLLWLVGWAFDLVGLLFKFLAGLIWGLLRFIVPIAVIAAAVYFLVRLLRDQNRKRDSDAAAGGPAARTGAEPPAGPPPGPPASTSPTVTGSSPIADRAHTAADERPGSAAAAERAEVAADATEAHLQAEHAEDAATEAEAAAAEAEEAARRAERDAAEADEERRD